MCDRKEKDPYETDRPTDKRHATCERTKGYKPAGHMDAPRRCANAASSSASDALARVTPAGARGSLPTRAFPLGVRPGGGGGGVTCKL